MNPADAVCLALYVAVLGLQKTRDSLLVTASFATSVLYTSSPAWASDPASVNHLIIALCFIPALFLLSRSATIAVFLYVVYHWAIAGDYLFFSDQQTLLSQSFKFVSPTINAIIMLVLLYAGTHGQSIRINSLAGGWLSNLLLRLVHHKKMEGR